MDITKTSVYIAIFYKYGYIDIGKGTEMETKEAFCYHSLHNSVHGKSEITRVDDKNVLVSLPEETSPNELNVDFRDSRVLICFDGDIPSGGLPKGSTVLLSLPLGFIFCHQAKVYKQRDDFEDEPNYTVKDKEASIFLYRHFVLLKTGRAIFRKYKPDTLQPKYLIVDVHDGFAGFSTSSY